jgi:hypothetical protein
MESTNKPVLLKSAIIGKIWTNKAQNSILPNSFALPSDMAFGKNESYLIGGLSMRTNRHLNASLEEGNEVPVVVKAGEKLFFYANNKRTDNDPDYSVSVILPQQVAEAVIENDRRGLNDWRASHTA